MKKQNRLSHPFKLHLKIPVRFHKEMITEKNSYITQELPQIEQRIIKVRKELNNLLSQEKSLIY